MNPRAPSVPAPARAVTEPALPAQADVDLDALRSNVRALAERSGRADVMAVVKADAYGHGLLPCARAAREGGAGWLGVAQLSEALALRAAGDTGRLMSWLHVPGDAFADAVAGDIDLSASGTWAVEEVAAAARAVGRTARLHLKIDTGLARGGATPADWPELVDAALRAEAEGAIRLVGVWSHMVWADVPDHPTSHRQVEVFTEAVRVSEARGADLEVRHLANSAAALTTPAAHFDLVRPGLAVYGLSPVPQVGGPDRFGLRPVMTLRGRVALVKQVPAGTGVSYGHAYTTPRDTTLALVPLGYADGLPRSAENAGPLQVAGRRHHVAGRVCMDQVVVDLGDRADVREVREGDPVVVFGDATRGEPSAQDWADAAGTISYEIVTRVGSRVPRVYQGSYEGSYQDSYQGTGRGAS
ncbi:MAG TPA: alanine racemase [Actinomycetales bacterium]|nr:alanine racemase [Actinomycetales bacterium]